MKTEDFLNTILFKERKLELLRQYDRLETKRLLMKSIFELQLELFINISIDIYNSGIEKAFENDQILKEIRIYNELKSKIKDIKNNLKYIDSELQKLGVNKEKIINPKEHQRKQLTFPIRKKTENIPKEENSNNVIDFDSRRVLRKRIRAAQDKLELNELESSKSNLEIYCDLASDLCLVSKFLLGSKNVNVEDFVMSLYSINAEQNELARNRRLKKTNQELIKEIRRLLKQESEIPYDPEVWTFTLTSKPEPAKILKLSGKPRKQNKEGKNYTAKVIDMNSRRML